MLEGETACVCVEMKQLKFVGMGVFYACSQAHQHAQGITHRQHTQVQNVGLHSDWHYPWVQPGKRAR